MKISRPLKSPAIVRQDQWPIIPGLAADLRPIAAGRIWRRARSRQIRGQGLSTRIVGAGHSALGVGLENRWATLQLVIVRENHGKEKVYGSIP